MRPPTLYKFSSLGCPPEHTNTPDDVIEADDFVR